MIRRLMLVAILAAAASLVTQPATAEDGFAQFDPAQKCADYLAFRNLAHSPDQFRNATADVCKPANLAYVELRDGGQLLCSAGFTANYAECAVDQNLSNPIHYHVWAQAGGGEEHVLTSGPLDFSRLVLG